MKLAVWLIIFTLFLAPNYDAEPLPKKKDTRSFWEKVFLPQPKPKPKRKSPHHLKKPKSKPSPTIQLQTRKEKVFIVDHEWMAHYWILEMEWDYAIPEDRDIKYVNGKYHVPAVVYRHLQDMMAAGVR